MLDAIKVSKSTKSAAIALTVASALGFATLAVQLSGLNSIGIHFRQRLLQQQLLIHILRMPQMWIGLA